MEALSASDRHAHVRPSRSAPTTIAQMTASREMTVPGAVEFVPAEEAMDVFSFNYNRGYGLMAVGVRDS